MDRPPTPAEQDYLQAIHRLGGVDRQVCPMEIAANLNVRAPSVTGMLKRLAEMRWVTYQPGSGAQLTTAGATAARRVIRRHRLVELLLVRVLGLDWSEVSAEADVLVHAISPRLEQAIAAHLGDPQECPHGHPIPAPDGTLRQRSLVPLGDVPTGQQVVIREVAGDEPERLRRWEALGLVPGAVVHVVHVQPVEDVVRIQVGDTALVLARQTLRGLLGEPAPVA